MKAAKVAKSLSLIFMLLTLNACLGEILYVGKEIITAAVPDTIWQDKGVVKNVYDPIEAVYEYPTNDGNMKVSILLENGRIKKGFFRRICG